jgi:hypothetical protein
MISMVKASLQLIGVGLVEFVLFCFAFFLSDS